MTGDEAPLYSDPSTGGLWARYRDGDRVNHGAWLRACAEHGFVGTCRLCGQQLVPEHPYENAGRVDYTCRCVSCSWEQTSPGGRVLRRSTRHGQMPAGWWERRMTALKKGDTP